MSVNLIKNIVNRFWIAHKKVLKKNLIFKTRHNGETCIILGNGASLKYYNLSALPNLTKVCCTYSLLDKRIRDIGVSYCVIPDSYFLYFLRRHSRSNKIIFNLIRPIIKKIFKENPGVKFFTPLTNFYSLICALSDNVHYFYHFNKKDTISCNLDGTFSMYSNALEAMIGLAKYMGFSKAILLGCDYMGSPKLEGHFYSDSYPRYGKDDLAYIEKIKKAAGEFNVEVVLLNGSYSPLFPSANFESLFGTPISYQENKDFINFEDLELMRKALKNDQIVM
jgi:hypothetical protein